MSGFGNRGPNVSRYVADLNKISPQQPPPANDFEDDLNFFTTGEFFDFDMGDSISSLPANDFDTQQAANDASNTIGFQQNQTSSDFLSNDFNFSDFQNFPAVGNQTGIQGVQPNPYPLAHQQLTSPVTNPSAGPRTGEKRKAADVNDPSLSPEEAARIAAEEDKRRRNTAASARFRIKKKQREQALEKQAKEMTEKASMLETKVQQLEMENKWLKSLITEKNEGKTDFAELYQKFTSENSPTCDSISSNERTDGVGTKKPKTEKA